MKRTVERQRIRKSAGRSLISLRFPAQVPALTVGEVLQDVANLDMRLYGLEVIAGQRVVVDQLISDRDFLELAFERPDLFLDSVLRVPLVHLRPTIASARFDSPGVITIEASGAVEKLIDILHSGKLQNEERQAIIARIHAETSRQLAETRRLNADALRATVDTLLAVGFEKDAIRQMLIKAPALDTLIGVPIVRLENALTSGELAVIEKEASS